jgi:hypothetical protein
MWLIFGRDVKWNSGLGPKKEKGICLIPTYFNLAGFTHQALYGNKTG